MPSGQSLQPGDLIAVSGASGFIGLYVCELLLSKGYRVRAIVRDTSNPDSTTTLKSFPQKEGQLEFVSGSLEDPQSFEKAVQGAQGVVHLASPYKYTAADPQKEIVDPAIQGVVSMVEACSKASSTVKRLVVTSSGGAAIHFPVPNGYTFTPKDWNTTSSLTNNPYFYSKKLAEEAGWAAWTNRKHEFDFVVVNPLLVLGPPKTNKLNASQEMLKNFMLGVTKTVQAGTIGVTDVRDVALAHLIALENPAAVGNRLFCYSTSVTWKGLLEEVKKQFPDYPVTPVVNDEQPAWFMDNSLLKSLGLSNFKSFEEMVHDTFEAFIHLGVVPDLRSK